MSGIMYVD